MSDIEPWPQTSFVGRLPALDRSDLVKLGGFEAYNGGVYILHQGEPGNHVFVVHSGEVRIMVSKLGGGQHRVASCTRGDLLGEVAHLDRRPRSASAVAYRRVLVQRLAGEVFDRYLDSHPRAYRVLARSLTERLRAAENRFVTASADVEGRVAVALCDYVNAVDSHSPEPERVWCTQGDLAMRVGASAVSVHRILRKFAGLGYLETEHRSILVKNLAAIEKIAGIR
ncbi:putative Crp/Fnr-family transcriptional regulator [Actinoplanes missouriensis 431]|uniref:Putative Crp/Fnr-family transcriptional regulator n=1 Tax=Actinoplanes missouriensis (strain ATCC 14538 / DSM 43046 / CBS 188.64 / JCM 3121 / NBRC 102363 / NCIMB 12654 / NRRL B-3342 / UNCC 431) TaxID=512565 RepID=I0HGM8_ACTM4|nr:Crp/Fnr family transcriptional regulator [Actinoplanes missouriensis]BAL92165.1 putative Crp/Fnr-family transcriptional regulator [Actinoplanes missouriensis 431]